MRIALLVVSAFCVASATANSRQKRFINTDALSFLPHSLSRLGDYARDLSDQLSSQASMAVQQMMPQSSQRASASRREQLGPQPKRSRIPAGRETEEDEVETFDPEEAKVNQPKPDHSVEDNWFRPLVPFSFSFGLLTPWWAGPNVCVERDEVEEPEQNTEDGDFGGFSINFETTRCVPSDSSYTCTKKIQSNGLRKTVIIRRQCCHGYIRRTDRSPGCALLKMNNVLETLKALEMDGFSRWVEDSGLKQKLITENFTLFSPSNEAIVDYEDDIEDNEISAIDPVKRMTDISSAVQGHVVEGFVNVDNIEDEQIINTLDGDVNIRINKYNPANQIVTANCIPIVGKNNFATNGIVHLVSGVLPQPKKSLAEMIEENEELNTLKKLIEQSGFMEELKKPDQPWTLFAPTNEAFKKLPRSLREEIESGEACFENILHEHLVKGTICTSAVIHQTKVKNILNNVLHVTRDEVEKLRVNGALINSENSLATNGVLHAVEKVLIPPQAQDLMKSLESEERQDILRLIETANLESVLKEMKNITFFVPSREAMQNLPNDTLEAIEKDPDLAKSILLSHMVASHLPTAAFEDNKQFETLGGSSVNIKLHEVFPGLITGATVQCAYITSHDHHACGAVMHKINKVLMPPRGSIVNTLKSMEGHEIVVKMLEDTELEKKLDTEGPFTFLAPIDEAFERMSESSLKELMENKTNAEEMLKMHVLPETLCCNGINHITPFHRQFVRTMEGSILPLQRSIYDRVKFGRARALQCDNYASNGLVHSISRVITKHRPSIITLFGI